MKTKKIISLLLVVLLCVTSYIVVVAEPDYADYEQLPEEIEAEATEQGEEPNYGQDETYDNGDAPDEQDEYYPDNQDADDTNNVNEQGEPDSYAPVSDNAPSFIINGYRNVDLGELWDEENERWMVGLRSVAEALGAVVVWGGQVTPDDNGMFVSATRAYEFPNSVHIFKNGRYLRFIIGIPYVYVRNYNTESALVFAYPETDAVRIDAAPQIINDRTFLPIRAVVELLELGTFIGSNNDTVYWTEATNTTVINSAQTISRSTDAFVAEFILQHNFNPPFVDITPQAPPVEEYPVEPTIPDEESEVEVEEEPNVDDELDAEYNSEDEDDEEENETGTYDNEE